MKHKLKILVDVTLTLACLTIAGLMVEQRYYAMKQRPLPIPTEPFAIGHKAPVIDGVRFDKAERTLLIVMKSTCRFCDASVPFWLDILTKRNARAASLQVIAVSDESVETAGEYLAQQGVSVDAVVSARVPTPGTPLLILVGADGLVAKRWLGKPPSKELEKEILDAMHLRDAS